MNRWNGDLIREGSRLLVGSMERGKGFFVRRLSSIPTESSTTAAAAINDFDEFTISPKASSSSTEMNTTNDESPDVITKDGRKLNMVIAASQLFSRREAESLIQQKRVSVAGKVINRPQHYVNDYDSNLIEIDGVPLRAKYNTTWPRIWATQKRREEIMSERDPNKSRSLFFDRLHNNLLPAAFQQYGSLKPIYRLGYQVEGLVMVTNSGELARLLSHHPTDPLPLVYKVRVHGIMNEGKLRAITQGVFIDGKRYAASTVKRLPPFDKTNSWLEIGITNYQKEPRGLETMLKKLFLQPSRLISLGFGPFRAESIFNDNYEKNQRLTAKQLVSDASNGIGVNAFVKEVKLPPELHAVVMRHMNNRHVIQPHHIITSL